MKNKKSPWLSTTKPLNPPMNFPGRVINELNSAYWVAVYARLTRLDIQAIKTAMAKPPQKLSPLMVITSIQVSAPTTAIKENNKLVAAESVAPASNTGNSPYRGTSSPPTIPPSTVMAKP